MSYDVWLEADLGNGRIRIGDLDENYTSNCGPMLYAAIGVTLARHLRRALRVMANNRPAYEAMEPTNGWGDLDGWMAYLGKIADACERAPRARLGVSA